jgi:polyferredoxin
MPLIRCWFNIPYIFCHSCPGKCAWGLYRNTFIPAYIGLNLDRRFWCYSLCPLGQIQDNMPKKKMVVVKKPFNLIRFLILILSAIIVFTGLSYLGQEQYSFTAVGLFLLLYIVLGSVYICRPFCNTLCPIGALGDLTNKFRKKV